MIDASGEPASATRSTVLTFLIADVRGYTRFTVDEGDEAAARLASVFADLSEEIVGRHGGSVVELRGDEVLAIFTSARDALRASVALQRRFDEVANGDSSLPLKVGIGLDAGDAVLVKGGYRGGALNRAARLCSIAGEGEVFASKTVVGLAGKTDGLVFVDRGAVTLKGLVAPLQVLQVTREGRLPEEAPALQAVLPAHPSNLPDDPTPFIGREQEIAQICALVQQSTGRLVTLTGPGGTGKSRLALQVGNVLLYDFADGVFFVPLASLTDPALIASVVTEVLGIKETTDNPPVQAITEHLGKKHVLLVLDNYEHLVDATDVVSSLLDACRQVHVLVTSRVPLHLTREREFPVPPLAVPDLQHAAIANHVSGYEAVAFFVERVQAVRPGFELTNDNARAVVEVCARVDGLPLAIELAAARTKLFSPQALLQRLSNRLELLTGGAKDRPTRQQTLRGTIDWSYSLLSPDEQALFARLSVFAGGCTLEAVEVVCAKVGTLDALESMASLVDKSLVRQGGEEESRFSMLQTMREYAREKLAEREEESEVRVAHARYCVHLAEELDTELIGPSQEAWLQRLDSDLDNMRAALAFSLEQERREEVLRLGSALFWFWMKRGYWAEGRHWLEEGLEGAERIGQDVRANGMWCLGSVAFYQGDYTHAVRLLQEALSLFREMDDVAGTAKSLNMLGNASYRENLEQATLLFEESLALYRQLGDKRGIAVVLAGLGTVAADRGNYAAAQQRLDESMLLFRAVGDVRSINVLLITQGELALWQGDPSRAGARFEESLTLARELNDKAFMATSHGFLGWLATTQGKYERAEERFRDALLLCRELGAKPDMLVILGLSAGLAMAEGNSERAGRLLSAVAAGRDTLNLPIPPIYRDNFEKSMDAARASLGDDGWERARQVGRTMSLEDALTYALNEIAD